jgi:hypothetical protein
MLDRLFEKKSKCVDENTKHSFGKWTNEKVLRDDQGHFIIIQSRRCEKCCFIMYDKQEF